MIVAFTYNGQEWYWNGFWGFYFQPVGTTRKRERIVKEGGALYTQLRSASNYP
jgi:hypothetical protein